MTLILDGTASTAAHSAAGTLVPAAIWVGALAASTAVILLHAASLSTLRDRLDELGQGRAPAPADRSERAAPMFGALYQTQPTLLDRMRAVPVSLITAAAVLLAALSGLLLLRGVGDTRDLAVSQAAAIGQMRAAHDSLSSAVAALRDSLRAVRAAPVAAAGAPAASPRPRPRGVTRVARSTPSRPDLPPAPSFEAPTPSSR